MDPNPTPTRRTARRLATGVAALGLAVTPAIAHAATPVTLVAWEGSTWRIHDQGQDLIATFAAPAFDDSTWKTYTVQPGKVLGYGDTDVQAPALEFGGNSAFKHPVTYFRTTFEVADPQLVTGLTLNHLRDDGTVIYLNGVEVLRSNMPAGTLTNRTFSTDTIDGAAEREVHTNAIPTTGLIAGTNTIAVQLHQRSDSSSDIALKLSLTGEQEDEIPVPLSVAAPAVVGVVAAGLVGLAALRRPRLLRRSR